MRTKQQAIADAITRRVLENQRRHFSAVHDEVLREFYQMSTVTSGNNIGAAPQPRPEIGREIPDSPQSLAAASPAKLAPAGGPYEDSIRSGMNVGGSQVVVGPVKQSGHVALQGSYAGDHRSPNTGAGITDEFKTQGGPRDGMAQAKLSSRTPDAPKAESFPGNLTDSEAGN